MKVLIFEWLTGGGLWFDGLELDRNSPFQKQGRAMFEAVAADTLQAGHQVLCTLDRRFAIGDVESKPFSISREADLKPAIKQLAEEADAILIVAPECDGCLNRVLRWLSSHPAKLVSPNARFVQLTSDKQTTSEWLRRHNVAVPDGINVACLGDARDQVSLPAIGKPNMGAGGDEVHLIEDWDEPDLPETELDWRVESFVAGESVSVSVISSGRQHIFLTPTGQLFDRPLGHYVAARHPLNEVVASRATRLALETTKALPATKGYFGIDMIIGDGDAWVVEVNPRLTMSYLRLREIEPFNLAQTMLDMASLGQPA